VAKTNPFEFLQQVREEGNKVTWPSRREITISTVMVFIMVVLTMIFFTFIDTILNRGQMLLIGAWRPFG